MLGLEPHTTHCPPPPLPPFLSQASPECGGWTLCLPPAPPPLLAPPGISCTWLLDPSGAPFLLTIDYSAMLPGDTLKLSSAGAGGLAITLPNASSTDGGLFNSSLGVTK